MLSIVKALITRLIINYLEKQIDKLDNKLHKTKIRLEKKRLDNIGEI